MSASRRTPGPPQPPAGDLLKIAGVGPALARRLAEAGIISHHDLASLTPGRVADVLAGVVGVSAERIASQDWIGQARRLAADVPADTEGHQRYATFHAELLIDADGRVRRTKVRHYQTDTEDSWPGWDSQRLIATIRAKAALDTRSAHPAEPQLPPQSPVHVDGPSPAEPGTRGSFRSAGQPTAVRMTLRVGQIDDVDAEAVDFIAEVAARPVGSSDRHPLATASGIITIDEPMSLDVAGPPLPPGLHGLEAVVLIYGQHHQPEDEPLCRRSIAGDLIHVTGE